MVIIDGWMYFSRKGEKKREERKEKEKKKPNQSTRTADRRTKHEFNLMFKNEVSSMPQCENDYFDSSLSVVAHGVKTACFRTLYFHF